MDGLNLAQVLVLSPYLLIEQGLRALLADQDQFDVVTPATLCPHRPAVVLYDVTGLARHGDSDLRELCAVRGHAVLAFSPGERQDLLRQALDVGAAGVLPFDVPAPDLVSILCAAVNGHLVPAVYLDREFEMLSGRERQILALVATGRPNLEIAAELHLGINTVKTYIRTAYRKIGVTSRTQAVLWWLEHQTPPVDPDRLAAAESTPPDRAGSKQAVKTSSLPSWW